MEKAEYLARYDRECRIPVSGAHMKRLLTSYAENAEAVRRMFTGQLDMFMKTLSSLQEKKVLGPIHSLTISFLFASLACGDPCLMYEVYPDYPFLRKSLVSEVFAAPWLYPDWGSFYEELWEHTQRASLSTVVRAPYVKSSVWDTARYFLHFFSTFVKLMLDDIDHLPSFQALQKDESFEITFGEYMDWQRLVYARYPAIDLFNRDPDEPLVFRRFRSAVYEDKLFEDMELDDTKFENCVFRKCVFRNTHLRGALLAGCTFENCDFESVRLDGARFDGTELRNVKMSGIRTNCMADEPGAVIGGFTQTEVSGCYFQSVEITDSDFSASRFQSCLAKSLSITDSTASDSLKLLATESGGEPA